MAKTQAVNGAAAFGAGGAPPAPKAVSRRRETAGPVPSGPVRRTTRACTSMTVRGSSAGAPGDASHHSVQRRLPSRPRTSISTCAPGGTCATTSAATRSTPFARRRTGSTVDP
ncbi:hypothetical protein [Streptomyces peucetius]|uniref:Uncharacterized protein n=1 Tax=Streptomyces peucetius TaxID=1950 RepID=A0ABY6IGI3_STRPE|nr:hypothetical protein [Streptomyces peucetius]UYQ65017.1 hypothetical protein OGH68_28530 [Streptomyces peucetius]